MLIQICCADVCELAFGIAIKGVIVPDGCNVFKEDFVLFYKAIKFKTLYLN